MKLKRTNLVTYASNGKLRKVLIDTETGWLCYRYKNELYGTWPCHCIEDTPEGWRKYAISQGFI